MFVKHIARGTTDPEYWIFDLNYLFYQIEFVIVSILAAEITQVLDSIPWVRCASGNVFALVGKNWQKFAKLAKVVRNCKMLPKVGIVLQKSAKIGKS